MPIVCPTSSELPPTRGYSQVVVATPGKMIFISGQIAMDPEGNMVGAGDLKLQTEKAMENLGSALRAAGATFDHIVKINWYVKNFNGDQLPLIREARARYLNQTHPPANTLAGVAELYPPDALIEVEAIAMLMDAG